MRSYLKSLRFAAFLIDALFVAVLILIFANLTCVFLLKIFPEISLIIYITWITFIVLGIVYILFKDGFNGKSIGKRVMGLIVIQADKKPCNFKKSFLRNFLLFLPIINFYEFYLFLKKSNTPRMGEKISSTKIEET